MLSVTFCLSCLNLPCFKPVAVHQRDYEIVSKHQCLEEKLTSAVVQFFRFYMGLYNNTWPDVHVQDFPTDFLKGSRVHVSSSCNSAAVSFSNAVFNHRTPFSTAGALFTFHDSTLWYSEGTREEALRVMHAAEASRDAGVLLVLSLLLLLLNLFCA
jgi:hypothetical protein